MTLALGMTDIIFHRMGYRMSYEHTNLTSASCNSHEGLSSQLVSSLVRSVNRSPEVDSPELCLHVRVCSSPHAGTLRVTWPLAAPVLRNQCSSVKIMTVTTNHHKIDRCLFHH